MSANSPMVNRGIPYAVLDAVASAIERARCHGREGPYGGYDYGYNPDFYGPEPEGGRYVVRDFRDHRSPTWGAWVHQTHDNDEHEQALLRLTRRHIAEAAIEAFLAQVDTLPKGRDAKQGSVGTKGSAVAEGHAPNPSSPSHIPLMNKTGLSRSSGRVSDATE